MSKKPPTVHGILPVNKPGGITSNATLYQLKRLFNERKIGHTGSLDPIATGMLVCCLGEATKLSSWLLNADKHYSTTLRLGVRTDTGDTEGKVLSERKIEVDRDQIEFALDCFRGAIEQIPPMYSAVKHKGKALYHLARSGQEVERKPRSVQIYSLEIADFSPPELQLKMHCSKGVYVRTLADDLGEMLGCGAHVQALYRNQVSPFLEEQMLSIEQLTAMDPDQRLQSLLPCDAHLGFMPQLDVSAPVAERLQTGNQVPLRQKLQPGMVRIYTVQDGFIGLAEVTEHAMVRPKKILRLSGRPDSAPGGRNCSQRQLSPVSPRTLSEKNREYQ